MPVHITKIKTKGKGKTKVAHATHPMSTVVDTLGDTQAKLKTLKPTLDALAETERACKSALVEYSENEGLKKDEEDTVPGTKYQAKVGKKANETYTESNKELFDALESNQTGLAYELMKFNVKDLKKYLNGLQIDKLLHEDRTGNRRITVKAQPGMKAKTGT